MASVEKTDGHVSERVSSTPGQNVVDETSAAINNEHNMSVRQSLRFWWKAIVFSFVISLCVVMELRYKSDEQVLCFHAIQEQIR
jgi:SP family general alpha glucoside:H+ symporter-like MFS transporter